MVSTTSDNLDTVAHYLNAARRRMKTQIQEIVDEVQQLFGEMSILLESDVVAQMVTPGDTFCSYRFEIDASTISGLVHVFRADERLWLDFSDAVRAYRTWTHWVVLME